ncbi:MAG: 2,3-bisphosphoglycerate-independent phosphoglycerate mutase [Candidatus Marinimicrobia bacterium]|nr:2,3-bisphosphoglycerate-independent phosphoglycerate mutase [Candidatus Neomarinimicrobiota bacterium]
MVKFILIILDGFGLREDERGNAYALGNTPNLDNLLQNKPMSVVETSGRFVGLPDGIMGNSEVGHTNIGAGRIVKQGLVRINDDIQNDQLKENPNLQATFRNVIENDSTLHLMGLLSDGGIHSHINHFKYILNAAKNYGVKKIAVHPFTDGRDTSPSSGKSYLTSLNEYLKELDCGRIATVCGRYYAMDRDNRWDRIELAYKMLIQSDGEHFENMDSFLDSIYANDETDEFITPKIIGKSSSIKDGDAVLTMNFRADRMRQMSRAFTEGGFNEFPTKQKNIHYVTMTQYQESFKFPVLYSPIKLNKIFPEILANEGFTQLRIAETEKYAHVTYFFNGGEESLFDGEDRILIPSPKVATYDLQPEMNARKVTDAVLDSIENEKIDAIIMNYANPDMVGHTGFLDAAIKAIETIDECVGEVVSAVKGKNGAVFLTADHGNLEMMINPETGEPHTAHTTLPVPFVLDCSECNYTLKSNGKLADIAPTILAYLNIPQPPEMSGDNLLIIKE